MLNTIIHLLWVVQLVLVIAACCSAGYEYHKEIKKSMEEYKKEKED